MISHLDFSFRESICLSIFAFVTSCTTSTSSEMRYINPPKGKVTQDSASGSYPPSSQEYSFLYNKLPSQARDQQSEVHLQIPGKTEGMTPELYQEQRRKEFQASRTDLELTNNQSSLSDRYPRDIAQLDDIYEFKSLNNALPKPSYTQRMQVIKKLFASREYENCLIELNDVLQYFPNDPHFNLMKGTVLQKLTYDELALKSYEKAYELSPSEKVFLQISYLKEKLNRKQILKSANSANGSQAPEQNESTTAQAENPTTTENK